MNEQERLRNQLGGMGETDDVDCLTIVVASYFEDHCERPENDPDHPEFGWGQWVVEQTLAMLDRIAEELAASTPVLGTTKRGE